MAGTGWTWHYIDECVTWPIVRALAKHWSESPPTHILLAGLLMSKDAKSKTGAPSNIGGKVTGRAPNGRAPTQAEKDEWRRQVIEEFGKMGLRQQ